MIFEKASPAASVYRPCVGMMIVNQHSQILLAKRMNCKEEASWQMPQGGIDVGETPEEALFREMQEELGTTQVDLLRRSEAEFFYDFPADLQPHLWNGKYVGQRQLWFLLRFKGVDSDIRIQTENPEFCDWGWFHIDDLIHRVVSFKHDVYHAVISEFKDHIL